MPKMIKTISGRVIKGERGQVLPGVLILLFMGSLLIAPSLYYASTSLKASASYRESVNQLYAADAGLEDALWKLLHDYPSIPKDPASDPDPLWEYGNELHPPVLANLNDKTLTVTMERITYTNTNKTYKVISTATGSSGSSTKVESHVSLVPFTFTNAATTGGSVETNPPPGPGQSSPEIIGDVVEGYDTTKWPFAAGDLRAFYWEKDGFNVKDYPCPYTSPINIGDYPNLGPWYYTCNKDNPLLAIQRGSGVGANEAILSGTIYVKETTTPPKKKAPGKLEIGQSGQDFTLNLNGNTIFVEGYEPGKDSITVGGKCNLTGSGCIIAEGDIDFAPNMVSDPNDFVFVMSIKGTVHFHPGGNFYGSIAGNISIELAPGNFLKFNPPPEEGVNFPTEGAELDIRPLLRTWRTYR